jgi:hypothetical protein
MVFKFKLAKILKMREDAVQELIGEIKLIEKDIEKTKPNEEVIAQSAESFWITYFEKELKRIMMEEYRNSSTNVPQGAYITPKTVLRPCFGDVGNEPVGKEA